MPAKSTRIVRTKKPTLRAVLGEIYDDTLNVQDTFASAQDESYVPVFPKKRVRKVREPTPDIPDPVDPAELERVFADCDNFVLRIEKVKPDMYRLGNKIKIGSCVPNEYEEQHADETVGYLSSSNVSMRSQIPSSSSGRGKPEDFQYGDRTSFSSNRSHNQGQPEDNQLSDHDDVFLQDSTPSSQETVVEPEASPVESGPDGSATSDECCAGRSVDHSQVTCNSNVVSQRTQLLQETQRTRTGLSQSTMPSTQEPMELGDHLSLQSTNPQPAGSMEDDTESLYVPTTSSQNCNDQEVSSNLSTSNDADTQLSSTKSMDPSQRSVGEPTRRSTRSKRSAPKFTPNSFHTAKSFRLPTETVEDLTNDKNGKSTKTKSSKSTQNSAQFDQTGQQSSTQPMVETEMSTQMSNRTQKTVETTQKSSKSLMVSQRTAIPNDTRKMAKPLKSIIKSKPSMNLTTPVRKQRKVAEKRQRGEQSTSAAHGDSVLQKSKGAWRSTGLANISYIAGLRPETAGPSARPVQSTPFQSSTPHMAASAVSGRPSTCHRSISAFMESVDFSVHRPSMPTTPGHPLLAAVDESAISANATTMTAKKNVSVMSMHGELGQVPYLNNYYGDQNDELQKLFHVCQQQGMVNFSKYMKRYEVYSKLGEGTYGEVYHAKDKTTEMGVALKVIPFAPTKGMSTMINDEYLKTADLIMPEVIISKVLSDLSDGCEYMTPGFVKVHDVSVVNGNYATPLLKAWNEFKNNNSDSVALNESPAGYSDKSKIAYLVIALGHGGRDLERVLLEKKVIRTEVQVLSILMQICLTLFIAEKAWEFEHRDLHWGNVLLQELDDPETVINFIYNGETIGVKSHGFRVSLIDFTNSRICHGHSTIYMDLAGDEDLFSGEGDLQFDVYRWMKEANQDQWVKFTPKTNCLWVHYLAEKVLAHIAKAIPAKRKTELRRHFATLLHYDRIYNFVCSPDIETLFESVVVAVEE